MENIDKKWHQRRSSTSNYSSMNSKIGSSQIPSALGQTITGALANIPFRFGIDSSGNYGYKKAGADTVIPFSSGPRLLLTSASQYYSAVDTIFHQVPFIDSDYFTSEAYNRIKINKTCNVDMCVLGLGGSATTVNLYLIDYPTQPESNLIVASNQYYKKYTNITLPEGKYIKAVQANGTSNPGSYYATCTIYLHS